MPLTVRDVFEDALQLVEIERAQVASPDIRNFVVRCINSAVQQMQLSGRDFFIREKITVPLQDGTASYALDGTILNVLLPARLTDGTPLRELSNRGDYDLFGQIYLGQVATGVARAKPMAIFVERTRQGGTDPVATTLYFAPTPNASYTAQIEVSKVPPVFTLSDVSEPSPVIPVAHAFTESILLPIVRWEMRLCRIFRRQEMLPEFESAYQAALVQLGVADPQVRKPGASADVLEQARRDARVAAREAYNRRTAAA